MVEKASGSYFAPSHVDNCIFQQSQALTITLGPLAAVASQTVRASRVSSDPLRQHPHRFRGSRPRRAPTSTTVSSSSPRLCPPCPLAAVVTWTVRASRASLALSEAPVIPVRSREHTRTSLVPPPCTSCPLPEHWSPKASAYADN